MVEHKRPRSLPDAWKRCGDTGGRLARVADCYALNALRESVIRKEGVAAGARLAIGVFQHGVHKARGRTRSSHRANDTVLDSYGYRSEIEITESGGLCGKKETVTNGGGLSREAPRGPKKCLQIEQGGFSKGEKGIAK